MSRLVYPQAWQLKDHHTRGKTGKRNKKESNHKGRREEGALAQGSLTPIHCRALWGGEESVANTAETLVAQGPREGTQASCSTVAAPAGSGDLPLAAALTPSTKATVTCPRAAVPSLSLHSLGSPGKGAQRPSWLKNPPVFFLPVTSGKCYTYIKTWQTHSLR